MNTASIESSLYKYLYEQLELTDNIHIFESIHYTSFDPYTKWVAIDTLSNSAGALPRALVFPSHSNKRCWSKRCSNS